MMAPVAVALQRQLREAGAAPAETPREAAFQASSPVTADASLPPATICLHRWPWCLGLPVRPAGKYFRSDCWYALQGSTSVRTAAAAEVPGAAAGRTGGVGWEAEQYHSLP